MPTSAGQGVLFQSPPPAKTVAGEYCRFRNFRENFIFANSIKRHISDVQNSRLRQDLPISINDRVILPFREGFIFTKLLAKKKFSRKFPNLQYGKENGEP